MQYPGAGPLGGYRVIPWPGIGPNSAGSKLKGRRVNLPRFLCRAATVVAASIALLGTGSLPALGQGPGGGPGRMFGGMGEGLQPSLNSRELERFVKLLGLDKDQEEAAKLLFESYQEQFRLKAEPIRTRTERAREEFRESRDPSVWQGLRGDMQKFQPVRDEMEKTLMGDLKDVLRPQQAEQWPRFERALRRDRALNRGLMSGERVNLLQIVERAELDQPTLATLAPVLDQYEIDLDRELTARTAFMQEQMSKAGEMFQAGDLAGMQKLMDKGREISVRVREINRRYARQVQDLVPETKRDAIVAEVKHQSFPRVYQKIRAERLLDAAATFSDLDEEQKVSVGALKETFTRDLSALNDDLAKAQEKVEMTVTADQIATFFRGGDEGPLGDLYRKRGTLGRNAEDSLRKILSPAQQERLPRNEDNGPGRRGGRGGPDQPARPAPRGQGGGA